MVLQVVKDLGLLALPLMAFCVITDAIMNVTIGTRKSLEIEE